MTDVCTDRSGALVNNTAIEQRSILLNSAFDVHRVGGMRQTLENLNQGIVIICAEFFPLQSALPRSYWADIGLEYHLTL